MNQKKNKSRSKENRAETTQLTVTLHLPSQKQLVLQLPLPCPANTVREYLTKALGNAGRAIYFESRSGDWLSDYKLQAGEGWIREELSLDCVAMCEDYGKLRGVEAYRMLKCVGVGGFSKVYLARDRRDGAFYAAKFIEKEKVRGKLDLIANERQVNDLIAFPFLVHMREFLETEQFYVMVLDYCPGGELFHLQRKVVRFTEEEARKYFIEVLLAIEYLHARDILYRDLKPENIMIDLKGHLRIADFGLAKVSKQKRYSYCGSLEYMSPEIVARAGHSFEVDYYCLGALLYEMVVGCPPFYAYNSPENDTKDRILYDEVEFPEEVALSDSLKDLVRQLLVKEPSQRLGHLAGVKEIKCHSWVGWINKAEYLERRVRMPYPVNLDCFNFDSSDITASANRILTALNAQKRTNDPRHSATHAKPNHKSRDNKDSREAKDGKESKEKRETPKNSSKSKNKSRDDKFKEYKTSYSLNKEKSHSNINYKEKGKNQSFTIKTAKKHSASQGTLKINRFQSIKNCYMGNASLSKFLRFPTETYETHLELSKERRSYVKLETENKEKGRDLKKRKARDEYAFEKLKRRA